MLSLITVIAAPTANVEAVPIPISNSLNSISHESLSLIELFLQADIAVKLVMIALIIGSIISWTIIIDKTFSFMKLSYVMNVFEKNFWSGKSLDEIFKSVTKKKESHPLALVFTAAMEEIDASRDNSRKNNMIRERINDAMKVAINKSLEELESGIGFLATIASSSPFIGLFGTVWGIMVSFQSIAINKNSTLAVVAPGIAEALLATAIGLVVAIPAAIFYNKFSTSANKIYNRVENFALELSNLISRDID